jgi:hypothetical protein
MEQAPLQVNISYQARSEIDAVLAPLVGKTHVESTSGIPGFLQEHNTVDELHLKYDLYAQTVSAHCDIEVNNVDMSQVTLQIFETARKEIFWDIFSGLFPKVVAASH